MKSIPWWAHFAHFGIAASGVLSVVGTAIGVVPGPVGIAGAIIAATAGPVKNIIANSLPPGD